MSPRDRRPEALVLDPGVLREGSVCELGGQFAVEARGGVVVTPWRDRFRAAQAAELEVSDRADTLPDGAFTQVVVHLQKSRAATWSDLVEAWRLLAPEGQLLLCGTNALGVTSAVKRLASELAQDPIVVTNRARARVVRFRRDAGAGPEPPEPSRFPVTVGPLEGPAIPLELTAHSGVFSARKLDAGSALLLDRLAAFVGYKPPRRVVDLGCGTGVLGIAAATLYPEAECLLVDGDARAIACAEENVTRLGLGDRARCLWWDAREPVPDQRFDLALVNPPFHQHGPEVDLGPALALFDSLPGWLSRNGRALVVANRTLPWEKPLESVGHVETVATARGYKLLSVKRSARSSSSRGRNAPGARSAGRSRPPTRSR